VPRPERWETVAQRDADIRDYRDAGMTQRAIAEKLGITQPAVCYSLQRSAGKPRRRRPKQAGA
jgi:predicted transcriptional regulator